MSNIELYTDGAYSSMRDQGGIGIIFVKDGLKISQYAKMYPHTTNNQMEIAAVLIGLKSIKLDNISSITVYSDSQYVIGCASKGWKRKKNLGLWKQYDEIKEKLDSAGISLIFKWVHGHNGNLFNEQADKLAVLASQSFE